MQQHIYLDMCSNGIFMNAAFMSQVRQTSPEELEYRWLGIKELAGRRKDLIDRAAWMVKMMWTDTAREVGKREYQRLLVQKKQQEEADRQSRQKQRNIVLGEQKWQKWQRCPNKPELVETALQSHDEFYQEFFRTHYMPPAADLEKLSRETVLYWLWNSL